MSEEEENAIEQLKSWREYIVNHRDSVNKANDIEFYLRTALNLIKKQKKEIEELNKLYLKEKNRRIKYGNILFEHNLVENLDDFFEE